jgi:hypothetical protein
MLPWSQESIELPFTEETSEKCTCEETKVERKGARSLNPKGRHDVQVKQRAEDRGVRSK